MSIRYETKAILKNKRIIINDHGERLFIVDVTCKACGHTDPLAFRGWAGFKCLSCGRMMKRTKYKPNK